VSPSTKKNQLKFEQRKLQHKQSRDKRRRSIIPLVLKKFRYNRRKSPANELELTVLYPGKGYTQVNLRLTMTKASEGSKK
jgi:hypothetical protein